ncbi:hypothetical protein CYY_000922 [Polysphondylium violaceum]|uniref:Uncharacterized protein n=1 Tax=Polysphondylium violaceum TaxID=133409 RepID=A0A8J4QA28_9MYCE|nr:hypothetical protein CYY_000922 [Polysphondylium violaceum]
MNQLYRLIFNNIYISKKIFTTISKIQYGHNSLKYDDIVDIKWMIEYNHLSLLRDKATRGFLLDIQDNDCIYRLVNLDLDLFKLLFTRYKYSQSCKSVFEKVIQANNLEAVKWVSENGFAHELERGITFTLDSDPEILSYLIENRWYIVHYNSILKNYSLTCNTVYSLPILQVFKQHTPTLNNLQAQEIINCLLARPIPLVFDVLSPLFQENLKIDQILYHYIESIDTYPIISYIVEKNLYQFQDKRMFRTVLPKIRDLYNMSQFIDQLIHHNNYNNNNIKSILLLYFPVKFTMNQSNAIVDNEKIKTKLLSLPVEVLALLLDHGLCFNSKNWIINSSFQVFVYLWNRFKSLNQLLITSNGIVYYPIASDKKKSFVIDFNQYYNLHLIDVKTIDFIIREGCGIESFRNIGIKFHQNMAMYTNIKRDRKEFIIIKDLVGQRLLNGFLILSTCIEFGNTVLFKYLYPHRVGSIDNELKHYVNKAIQFQRLEILEYLGYDISSLGEGVFKVSGIKLEFLKQVCQHMDRNASSTSIKLLNKFINDNRYENVKYMLSAFIYESMDDFLPSLLYSTSEAMIDLVYRNREAFKRNSNSHWQSIFENTITSDKHSYRLTEYFIRNHIVRACHSHLYNRVATIKLHIITPTLSPERHRAKLSLSLISLASSFNDLMYLVDNQVYDSVDVFIELLLSRATKMNTPSHLLYGFLEYLYRNQDRFKVKPIDTQYIINQLKIHQTPLQSYIRDHYLDKIY